MGNGLPTIATLERRWYIISVRSNIDEFIFNRSLSLQKSTFFTMSKVCTQDRTVKLPQNACFLFWHNLYPHLLDTLCMCVKPRPRLTCSWERAPLCICRSSLLPLIHRVSRGSCPHGNLYRILTPWDAGSLSSSSATSVLLKSDGDSANWKDLNLFGWTQKLQLPVGCSQRQHDWFLLRCEDLKWNLI